jgi:hypothetical protein
MQVLKCKTHQVKVVYNKEIYGNKQQNAESQKVPIKVGDYIELTHLEGVHRATLTNVDNSKQESFWKKKSPIRSYKGRPEESRKNTRSNNFRRKQVCMVIKRI